VTFLILEAITPLHLQFKFLHTLTLIMANAVSLSCSTRKETQLPMTMSDLEGHLSY